MADSRRLWCALLAALSVVTCVQALGVEPGSEAKKPSLTLRVMPPVGFAPLRTRFVVEVRGGDNDYEDFYCPKVEWDWGDGTISVSSEDCAPYEPGKSEIPRRFSIEHTFQQEGGYRVAFRLKQRDRVVASSSATVQVRGGGINQ
jgi:hypothetical protein